MLLQLGSVGREVEILQSNLNLLGYACKVDGNFGEATKSAVIKFQKASKLIQDGMVGDNTMSAIKHTIDIRFKPRIVNEQPQKPKPKVVDKVVTKVTEKIFEHVHPEVVKLAIKLRTILKDKYHIEIKYTYGYRSFAEQNELYAKGRTKAGQIVTNAKGGESYHNYGLAVDFVVMKHGEPDWNDIATYKRVGEIAESLGLESGANFKSIKDYPHLQKTFGLSIAELKSGKRP